ncbi:MAG: hypothetical protein WBD99_15445 [Thermodesulfobacteriota bacterium]
MLLVEARHAFELDLRELERYALNIGLSKDDMLELVDVISP